MDIEKLRVLLAVVERGSVQGAARALGLPRSQLRRRLDALETEVGVALLHRDSVGVRLTDAGVILVERGAPLVASALALIGDARGAAAEAAGVFHVFEPLGMPLNVRVHALLATHAAMPKMKVILRQVEDPIAHIDGPCELIIHFGAAPDRDAWFSRVMLRPTMQAMASPDYLAARGTPRCVEDLAEHEILGWLRPRRASDAWPLLGGGSVRVSPWFESPDMLLLRRLASEGGGILFCPTLTSFEDPGMGPLVSVLEEQIGDELMVRLSSRHHSGADLKTRSALQQIEVQLAGLSET